MNSRYVLGMAAAITIATTPAAAALRSSSGTASFTALGPAGMKIHGTTPNVSVSESNQMVLVRVGLSNLDTGISLRNRHMREKYLEVSKYPNAELVVKRSELKFPEEGKDSKSSASGTLTIHGKSRTVNFNYDAKRSANTIDVNGSVRVDIREYGIAEPSYLGLSVKPNVDVAVHFTAGDD